MNLKKSLPALPRGKKRAAVIVLAFVFIGALWIVASESLLRAVARDMDQVLYLEMFKSWLLLLISAVVIFLLIVWEYGRMNRWQHEREQMIEELHRSETNNRTLLNLIPDTIVHLNAEGEVIDFHIRPSAQSWIRAGDISGKKIGQILPAQISSDAESCLRDALSSGSLKVHEFSITEGDEQKHYEARFLAKDKHHVAVIIRDFSQQKKMEQLARTREQQLIQADKMATLGTMVSGVAHEINNPNNYILLNGKIVARMWNDVRPILDQYYRQNGDFSLAGMPYSQAVGKMGKLISGIGEGAQRIKQIVETFKAFARKDSGDLTQQVDVNGALRSATVILSNTIKKHTENFKINYGAGLPSVQGNSQQIEHVIINLITNSCQALTDKKQAITAGTSFDPSAEEVIIEIKDEGMGISGQDMKYIFDPFFTSKRDEGGTGLGLSIAYKIVQNHGGRLQIASQPESGTTARVMLPVRVK